MVAMKIDSFIQQIVNECYYMPSTVIDVKYKKTGKIPPPWNLKTNKK